MNNEVTPRLSRRLITAVALVAALAVGVAATTVLAQSDQTAPTAGAAVAATSPPSERT